MGPSSLYMSPPKPLSAHPLLISSCNKNQKLRGKQNRKCPSRYDPTEALELMKPFNLDPEAPFCPPQVLI